MLEKLLFHGEEGMKLLSSVVKNNRVRISGQKKIIFNAPNSQYSQKNEVINNEQKVDINYAELLQKSKQQAKNIIAEAKEAAEQIILEAQVEATKLAEAAKDEGNREGYSIGYDEGYKQGFAEGLEQGKTQYDTLIEEANQIKQKYLEDKEKLYEVSEKNMLMLAIDIAKQIIGDALGKDDKVYMELAYNALKLVQCQRKIQLKVSSDDLPYVLKNKNQLLSSLRGIDDIQIIEDSHLDRGSCIIDTGNGIIDASLKSQIEKIESALVELANSAQ